ncbi:MAG TPA: tetratricopeptide repeat protein, partial [Polyangiaceae bacterium]|nr:tetratricopeptide repeat protein [Polyangiaceae bacterium]
MSERARRPKHGPRVVSALAFAVAVCATLPAGAQGPKAATAAPAPSAPNGGAATPPSTPPAASTTDGGAPSPDANAPAAPEAPSTALDTRGSAFAAYEKALADKHLAPTEALSTQRLRDDLARIEDEISAGRRDEAISDLVYLVESPRFPPFAKSAEGRTARFMLGDALGRGGAHDLARAYLVPLLDGDPNDPSYRQAVHSLVDFGLESERPRVFLKDLEVVPPGASDEIRGDIAYLAGRAAESEGKPDEALAAYAQVRDRSRFWAQATYLTGVIQVEHGRFKEGEN